ncbi:MAG TPA: OmpA family protein, partial [Xanthobacteraceae bacterium]
AVPPAQRPAAPEQRVSPPPAAAPSAPSTQQQQRPEPRTAPGAAPADAPAPAPRAPAATQQAPAATPPAATQQPGTPPAIQRRSAPAATPAPAAAPSVTTPQSATPPAATAPSTAAPAATAPAAPAPAATAPAATAPATTGPAAAAPAPTTPEQANIRGMEQLRSTRQEVQEGGRTIIREPGRTIIREGDRTIIRHNETDRFRVNARDVSVQRRGSETVTTIIRQDGSRIISTVDEGGRLLRRMRRDQSGREVIIIDSAPRGPGFDARVFVNVPPPVIRMPRERYIVEAEDANEEMIYETLIAPPVERIERRYSLDEIRYSPGLRDHMRRVDVNTVTFETGSWEITQDQAPRLGVIANAIRRAIERNPREVFLIEGHTDAVGADVDNLSLSDRRAESVAVLLGDHFQVPPENLTTQGYGEQYLKVPTDGPERQNRRVTVRRITPLLAEQSDQRAR